MTWMTAERYKDSGGKSCNVVNKILNYLRNANDLFGIPRVGFFVMWKLNYKQLARGVTKVTKAVIRASVWFLSAGMYES